MDGHDEGDRMSARYQTGNAARDAARTTTDLNQIDHSDFLAPGPGDEIVFGRRVVRLSGYMEAPKELPVGKKIAETMDEVRSENQRHAEWIAEWIACKHENQP